LGHFLLKRARQACSQHVAGSDNLGGRDQSYSALDESDSASDGSLVFLFATAEPFAHW